MVDQRVLVAVARLGRIATEYLERSERMDVKGSRKMTADGT